VKKAAMILVALLIGGHVRAQGSEFLDDSRAALVSTRCRALRRL
jgi:hypothetical protein